jgi:DNA-binding winged helix-turn-helix (wHTH) protein/TolB-like protein/tetratricopeptide (TPR) repeat protein
MSKHASHFYEFGEFRLEPSERLLRRAGKVVPLPPKAFDLLLVLIQESGHLMTKEQLLRRVWEGDIVEEANLSHNVYKLREALGEKQNGEKFIETVPRSGYRFVGNVTEVNEQAKSVVSEQPRTATLIDEQVDRGQQPVPSRRPQVSASRRWIVLALLFVVMGAAVAYVMWPRHSTTEASIHSVAVLPFQPLSSQGRDETLELGMADALITKLSNVHQITVRPTSAVLKYSGTETNAIAAGREQSVDAVIDGKVQKVGDRIRVSVQLLRVVDGASLWAETFDDQFTNVFSVQDSISERAARALVSQISGEDSQRVAKHFTDNIEAYQLYLKGRYEWSKFSADGVASSISYYNDAIAIDPHYALAYAGLADAYSVQGAVGIYSPRDTAPLCRRAVEQALKYDPSLAQAHQAAGGLALLYEHDWATAKRELERANELNPNLTDVHELLGYYWEVMNDLGRARLELEKAQQASPLTSVVNMDLANLAYFERNYDQAITLYERAHKLDSDFVPLPFFPAQAYERKGDYSKSIELLTEELRRSPDAPELLALLGTAYKGSGKIASAQEILAKLEQREKTRFVTPFLMAIFYTAMDDKDHAFAELNRAVEIQDPQVIWVKLEPQLDGLHNDKRFAELLKRLGIV